MEEAEKYRFKNAMYSHKCDGESGVLLISFSKKLENFKQEMVVDMDTEIMQEHRFKHMRFFLNAEKNQEFDFKSMEKADWHFEMKQEREMKYHEEHEMQSDSKLKDKLEEMRTQELNKNPRKNEITMKFNEDKSQYYLKADGTPNVKKYAYILLESEGNKKWFAYFNTCRPFPLDNFSMTLNERNTIYGEYKKDVVKWQEAQVALSYPQDVVWKVDGFAGQSSYYFKIVLYTRSSKVKPLSFRVVKDLIEEIKQSDRWSQRPDDKNVNICLWRVEVMKNSRQPGGSTHNFQKNLLDIKSVMDEQYYDVFFVVLFDVFDKLKEDLKSQLFKNDNCVNASNSMVFNGRQTSPLADMTIFEQQNGTPKPNSYKILKTIKYSTFPTNKKEIQDILNDCEKGGMEGIMIHSKKETESVITKLKPFTVSFNPIPFMWIQKSDVDIFIHGDPAVLFLLSCPLNYMAYTKKYLSNAKKWTEGYVDMLPFFMSYSVCDLSDKLVRGCFSTFMCVRDSYLSIELTDSEEKVIQKIKQFVADHIGEWNGLSTPKFDIVAKGMANALIFMNGRRRRRDDFISKSFTEELKTKLSKHTPNQKFVGNHFKFSENVRLWRESLKLPDINTSKFDYSYFKTDRPLPFSKPRTGSTAKAKNPENYSSQLLIGMENITGLRHEGTYSNTRGTWRPYVKAKEWSFMKFQYNTAQFRTCKANVFLSKIFPFSEEYSVNYFQDFFIRSAVMWELLQKILEVPVEGKVWKYITTPNPVKNLIPSNPDFEAKFKNATIRNDYVELNESMQSTKLRTAFKIAGRCYYAMDPDLNKIDEILIHYGSDVHSFFQEVYMKERFFIYIEATQLIETSLQKYKDNIPSKLKSDSEFKQLSVDPPHKDKTDDEIAKDISAFSKDIFTNEFESTYIEQIPETDIHDVNEEDPDLFEQKYQKAPTKPNGDTQNQSDKPDVDIDGQSDKEDSSDGGDDDDIYSKKSSVSSCGARREYLMQRVSRPLYIKTYTWNSIS